ncbi:hypothetical protein LLS1_02170 [Leifsonia sp. LS1]|uniref:hypothetical protein n=1 Tax=Leifsonia sp. LS1 TaxID=2828483 RepID=UPI001CFE71FF|nr:hypothetical protein [Leifsonia sp. LS1]GIT78548.1 hypothetical protein LLS1_02170 [Leifsonia sp. LS1]
MNACADLVSTAERLARTSASSRRFFVDLGAEAGGVRRGPLWFWDAARGGRNRIRGRGFRPHVDDGTDGQARHFAGILAVAARIGVRATRWFAIHVLGDAEDSADGRLTDHALDLVRLARSGAVTRATVGDWIRRTICEPVH